MSAGPQESNPKRAEQRTPEHSRVLDLMKEIGSPDGYEPMPYSQIRRFMDKGESEANRVWGCLAAHTLRKGHWSAYAIKVARDGTVVELHTRHFAEILGIDPASVRRGWRQIVAEGRARNGSVAEGVERMYIRGDVPPPQLGEEKAQEDSTKLISASILKQIKDWPQERVLEFTAWWQQRARLQKIVPADLKLLGERILAEEWAAGVRGWGLKPTQQGPRDCLDPSAKAEREGRLEALEPEIKKFVLSSWQSVQDGKATPYSRQNGAKLPAVSLLPERTPRKETEQAGSLLTPSPTPNPTLPGEGKKLVKEQYAPPALSPLDAAGQKALDFLFQTLKECARACPRSKLAQEGVDPLNKGHATSARNVLDKVRAEEVPAFSSTLKQKFGANALGKSAGWGMVLAWAGDWDRDRLQREKEIRDRAEREARQKAAGERTRAEHEREEAEFRAALKAIPMDEWDARMKRAQQESKADPMLIKAWKHMTADDQERATRQRAENTVRRELQEKRARESVQESLDSDQKGDSS